MIGSLKSKSHTSAIYLFRDREDLISFEIFLCHSQEGIGLMLLVDHGQLLLSCGNDGQLFMHKIHQKQGEQRGINDFGYQPEEESCTLITPSEVEELKNRQEILVGQKSEQDFGGANSLYVTTQDERIKGLKKAL